MNIYTVRKAPRAGGLSEHKLQTLRSPFRLIAHKIRPVRQRGVAGNGIKVHIFREPHAGVVRGAPPDVRRIMITASHNPQNITATNAGPDGCLTTDNDARPSPNIYGDPGGVKKADYIRRSNPTDGNRLAFEISDRLPTSR